MIWRPTLIQVVSIQDKDLLVDDQLFTKLNITTVTTKEATSKDTDKDL